MTDKLCRRCLLRDLDDAGYHRVVDEYLASLREDWRAAPEEYERRLASCKACDHLANGLCTLCGCFVELRAVNAQNHCAKNASIW